MGSYLNNFIFLLFVLCFCEKGMSQKITRHALVTSGGNGYLIEYTLGETFCSTLINSNTILTLGMQQVDPKRISFAPDTPFEIRAYPTLTNENFLLSINSTLHQTALLTLNDGIGKLIFSKEINLTVGTSELSFDISQRSSGVYLLSVYTEHHYSQIKIVKY